MPAKKARKNAGVSGRRPHGIQLSGILALSDGQLGIHFSLIVLAVEGIECEFSGRKGVSMLCF